MSVSPGTRLGPYEIVAPLGAGGMGEVFRATDTRLGREVAVKVLPQHLSDNPEVRARFEREAKTVSSLSHPHICTLFDIGREGDVDFLVMDVAGGKIEILGIVDSVMHPGTRSFQRFDYPSQLDPAIQARMADIVRRIVPCLGLDWTLFNIELIHDPSTGRISILEVNPRMCGQFADLYEKVDGINGYEIALQVATGGRPLLRRSAGAHRVAASFPLRAFEPSRVERVPSPEDVRAAEALYPGTLVWVECEAGQRLDESRRWLRASHQCGWGCCCSGYRRSLHECKRPGNRCREADRRRLLFWCYFPGRCCPWLRGHRLCRDCADGGCQWGLIQGCRANRPGLAAA